MLYRSVLNNNILMIHKFCAIKIPKFCNVSIIQYLAEGDGWGNVVVDESSSHLGSLHGMDSFFRFGPEALNGRNQFG